MHFERLTEVFENRYIKPIKKEMFMRVTEVFNGIYITYNFCVKHNNESTKY